MYIFYKVHTFFWLYRDYVVYDCVDIVPKIKGVHTAIFLYTVK